MIAASRAATRRNPGLSWTGLALSHGCTCSRSGRSSPDAAEAIVNAAEALESLGRREAL